MSQTGAIFVEAYRNLNSKKLFWISLVLSVMVVGAFATMGINEDGISIGWWPLGDYSFGLNSDVMPPAEFYKGLFIIFGIPWWLTWIATILALISTGGIFVDLMTSGSIDLVLSKPIGRLRLFVTQYVAALLFVTLQITLFTAACFLLIGIRGGEWEPGLFLAVPVVVCFFSYLYSVCVLLGIMTRSTVAAILLTILFWSGLWLLSGAETALLGLATIDKQGTLEELANAPPPGGANPPHSGDDASNDGAKPETISLWWARPIHDVVYGVKTVLPKTGDTIGLLDRWLIDAANLQNRPGDDRPQAAKDLEKELVEEIQGRSVGWVVGTSLGFELVVLSLAALVFCRRDY